MKNYLTYKNKAFLFYVFFQTVQVLVSVCVALLLNWILDQISLAVIDKGDVNLINDFVICALYALVLGLLVLFSGLLKARCLKNADANIRKDLFKGILCKERCDFDKKPNAEYISFMNQNINIVEENLFKNKLSIYESVIGIIFATVLLFVMNPVVAIASLFLMSIPSLLPRLFSRKLASLQSDVLVFSGKYNVVLNDCFRCFGVIKDYKIENKINSLHNSSVESFEGSKQSFANKMSLVYGVSTAAGIFVQFLVIVFAGVLAVRGYLTIGSIVAVTQLTGQVISPAFQLSSKFAQLKSVKEIINEMEQIIKSSPDDFFADIKKSKMSSFEKIIEFKDVSFSFEDKRKLFDSLNVQLQKNKHYAVCGKSGCGKSTFLKLLSGYYAPENGKILIDGSAEKRVEFASVSQNVELFTGTLRDNITLFNSFSDEKINDAVEKSGLSDVVEKLPEGLETRLVENGSCFSGGERQRIAIARALIYDRPLLILDEATSALDSETAGYIEKTVKSLSDKTVVSVTHRTDNETLSLYDEVITLDSCQN